jgi:alpha-1,2-mannosyltransferase
VSEPRATEAAAGPASYRAPARGAAPSWRAATPGAVIAAATALALGLRLYQLLHGGHLLGIGEYDEGADFGTALRLVHGVIPYRDFVVIQPPGITELMAPAAALSFVAPAAWALAVGRLLTVAASCAGVVLGGVIARRRGLLATIVTCGLLAIYPASVTASRTVLLEPWLVLFCLAGVALVFRGGELTGSVRLLAWGGAAFGAAGVIKVWAVLPFLVLLAMCARGPGRTRGTIAFAAGAAGGFLAPTAPFAVMAPRAFYDSVVVAQLERTGARTPLGFRLQEMTGLTGFALPGPALLAAALILVLLVVAAQVAAVLVSHSPPAPLDWFAVLTTLLVVIAFLVPADFYYHYPAFLAPFLALALGLPLGRALPAPVGPGSAAGPGWPGAARSAVGGRSRAAVAVSAAAGVAFVALPLAVPGAEVTSLPDFAHATAMDRVIPDGACVVSDQVSVLIAVDRFFSSVSGCPVQVDGTGISFALGHGHAAAQAGQYPAVAAIWSSAFRRAQFVVLTMVNARRIAWTPALRDYFRANFRLVGGPWQRLALYARSGGRGGGR